jgi:hypothetical protein
MDVDRRKMSGKGMQTISASVGKYPGRIFIVNKSRKIKKY